MNTKHLKARILDLALQGKLVENSRIPNDLNSRIPSDFKPPFKIPNSWQWVKLGDICEIISDGIHGTPKYSETGEYFFINGNNLENKKIIIKSNTKKVNFDEFEKYKKPLGKNSVLVSINGTLGKVAFYNNEKIILGKSACYLNLLDICDKNFIYFIISSDYFLKYANKNATGTTIKNVSLKAMKNFHIPLPSLDEQERIVKKIDELFSQIDILETSKQSLLKNIKHTKTRILDLALQGKLVENSRIPTDLNSRIPSDFNPPFKIPNSWAWVKLGDICKISSGGTPSRNEAEFWENGTIPWLKIADIKDDYVNSSSEFITQKGLENSSAKIFKKGTLLFTIFATLGEVAILNIDASTNQAIVGLTPKKDNYITKFIFFALKNIKNSVNLIGRGATQKNINQTILKNFYIPLPPLDEQERIVKKIDELFEILEVIENSL